MTITREQLQWNYGTLETAEEPTYQDTLSTADQGLFGLAAQAISSRALDGNFYIPAMPAINTIDRKGENNAGFLFNQVRERALTLQIYQVLNSINTVGNLWHLITKPASSHTPIFERNKPDQAAHYINWLFSTDENGSANFFSSQDLAALREHEPQKYNAILRHFSYGITNVLQEITKQTSYPIDELITYFQTGATDTILRKLFSFTQGSASLPTVHAHTIAPGDVSMIRRVDKPIETLLKHYQTMDSVLMRFIGKDLQKYIEQVFPELKVTVIERSDNSDTAFRKYSALEIDLPNKCTVQQALDFALQILHKLEPVSKASLGYMSANRSTESRSHLMEVMEAQGMNKVSIKNYLRFLRVLQPTIKQLNEPVAVAEVFEKYTQLLVERDSILKMFDLNQNLMSNPVLVERLIKILHELDRLRISPEQAAQLDITDEDVKYLELHKESKFTVGDPLSVDYLLRDFYQTNDGICVKKLWMHFPVIGLSGAIDSNFGYTLQR